MIVASADVRAGVVVVQPAKQHAYQVAIALQQSRQLRRFITGVYYKPESFPYSLLPLLPSPMRRRALRELNRRTERHLSPQLVQSWPYAETLSRTIGRIGWIYRYTDGRSGHPLIERATDHFAARTIARMRPLPEAVYGFHNAALTTFTCARRIGITTVLDVPIVLDAYDIEQSEYQRLGFSERIIPTPLPGVSDELRVADWAIAPAPAVADSARRKGFAGRDIVIVPYGADTDVFTPRSRAEDATFRAVFAGIVGPRKGVHYLLEGWSQADVTGELVLVGPPASPAFVDYLHRRFAGVFRQAAGLTQPELAELFRSADVFVFPSLAEGSALVVYEALAAGLPCIVTEEAGSVVRDGVDGFVVPARDPGAIKNRIEMLYRDPQLRERMRTAARARGREFSWSRYHRTIGDVMSQILASRSEDLARTAERA